MTIKEEQEAIVEEFSLYPDWMEKYEYIIQLGKELPLIDPSFKTDDNLIRGCQSKVWLHTSYVDGVLSFTADSDALITKGLVAMVVRIMTGHTPQEIVASEVYFIDAIGLSSHLSQTRSNGLLAMLKQIKAYALAFTLKNQAS